MQRIHDFNLTRTCHGVLWGTALVLAAGLHARAQSPLEVVSVRENPADAPHFSAAFVFLPGRLQITNVSLEDLVAYAYDVTMPSLRAALIVGWPKSGIQRKRFDIQAISKTSEKLSAEERRRVVLQILGTRFGFQAHRERRLFRGYSAKLVRPGIPGPALKRVDFNCAEVEPAQAPKDESGRSLCRKGMEYLPRTAGPSFHGSGSSDMLVFDLGLTTRRLVVNETGLQGFYVWDIDYGPLLPGADRLEVAIREQLGITLVPNRVPADVVVIDNLGMPTPN